MPNATDATSGRRGAVVRHAGHVDARARTRVTCSATDAAGNQATQTLTYTVAAEPDVQGLQGQGRPRRGNVSFRLKASATGKVQDHRQGRQGASSARPDATLTAGKNKKVTLRLSKKARKAFKRKLRGGKQVKVKVTVTPALGGRSARLTLRRAPR